MKPQNLKVEVEVGDLVQVSPRWVRRGQLGFVMKSRAPKPKANGLKQPRKFLVFFPDAEGECEWYPHFELRKVS